MTQRETNNKHWSTQAEMEFIDGLGTHRPKKLLREAPSVVGLLQNYIKAARRRKYWGTVKHHRCIRHAQVQLMRLIGDG